LTEPAPTEQKLHPSQEYKICCSHAGEGGKKPQKEKHYNRDDCSGGLSLSQCFVIYHKQMKH